MDQLEKMIKDMVLEQMGKKPSVPASSGSGYTYADYPLGEKRPEVLKTPTGKGINEITLDGVIAGNITSQDVRIRPETLEMQAQVAESRGRSEFAANLRRAAELIEIPDERLLEMYIALRPYQSTKQELLNMAREIKEKYNAHVTAALIEEAAQVYENRGRLKKA